MNCSYKYVIWSRANHEIDNVNTIDQDERLQHNDYNRNCIIDRTAPQIYELVINVSIQNTVSILPNITCIGVLRMGKTRMDHVFSANTINIASIIMPTDPSK